MILGHLRMLYMSVLSLSGLVESEWKRFLQYPQIMTQLYHSETPSFRNILLKSINFSLKLGKIWLAIPHLYMKMIILSQRNLCLNVF